MGARVERADVIESGSPLRHSNLNQGRLKQAADNGGMLDVPRKAYRAELKRDRELEDMLSRERQKQKRIWSSIERALEGYDGANYDALRSEIASIVRRGVSEESKMVK